MANGIGSVGFYELDNGIDVVVNSDPLVEGEVDISVGSKLGDEKEWPERSRQEMTHLSEHFTFLYAGINDTIDMLKKIEDKEITTDGTTESFYCCTYMTGPSSQLRRMVRLVRESIQRSYNPREFEKEKGVIHEELRQMMRDAPTVAQDLLRERMYPDSPYSSTLAERKNNILLLNREQTEAYRNRLFRPNNLVVVITSDLAQETLASVVEREFGKIPSKQGVLRAPRYEVPDEGRVEIRQEFGDDDNCLTYVRLPLGNGVKSDQALRTIAVAYVLSDMLIGHDTSLFFLHHRIIQGKIYSPKVEIHQGRPEPTVNVYYDSPTDRAAGLLRLSLRLIERIAAKALPRSEFKRYQALTVRKFRRSMRDIGERNEWYVQFAATDNGQIRHREFESYIWQVTPHQLAQAAEYALSRLAVAQLTGNGSRTG